MNLNNLKVFTSVYKYKCMTTAAKELHLTQSGVSQHIRSLEESLGVDLFDRIHRKLVPTGSADRLFQILNPALFAIEEALVDVSGQVHKYAGLVRVGMPREFGLNRILPILSEVGRQYPEINFQIEMDFAGRANEKLLNGELDFAFVDEFEMDRRIYTRIVTSESLLLCCSKNYAKLHNGSEETKEFFETLDYIAYQQGEYVLRSWFHHHLKKKHMNLKVRAQVLDVEGLTRLVLADFGVGVLPDHKIDQLIKYGHEIKVFSGKGKPLANRISLAFLEQRQKPPHVKVVLESLQESFNPSKSK